MTLVDDIAMIDAEIRRLKARELQLLAANNREVERRREAEAMVERLLFEIEQVRSENWGLRKVSESQNKVIEKLKQRLTKVEAGDGV